MPFAWAPYVSPNEPDPVAFAAGRVGCEAGDWLPRAFPEVDAAAGGGAAAPTGAAAFEIWPAWASPGSDIGRDEAAADGEGHGADHDGSALEDEAVDPAEPPTPATASAIRVASAALFPSVASQLMTGVGMTAAAAARSVTRAR